MRIVTKRYIVWHRYAAKKECATSSLFKDVLRSLVKITLIVVVVVVDSKRTLLAC